MILYLCPFCKTFPVNSFSFDKCIASMECQCKESSVNNYSGTERSTSDDWAWFLGQEPFNTISCMDVWTNFSIREYLQTIKLKAFK